MKRKYVKIPVEIEALQLTERNIIEVYQFIHGEKSVNLKCRITSDKWDEYEDACRKVGGIRLKTMESDNETQIASFGDFIIKGIQGEFYPCKPDIFSKTYQIIK